MSIFTKVSLLFFVSVLLMGYISFKTNQITDKKIELLYKEKYIQASKEILNYLISANNEGLDKLLIKFNYKKLPKSFLKKQATLLYENAISFGDIKIYQQDNNYYLYMSYLDDDGLFYDMSQGNEIYDKNVLNFLIFTDLFVLFILFLVIIKMLIPLKHISNAMEKFGSGNYSSRLKQSNSNDEISKVVKKFNAMAANLEVLISARVQLLRDVSHELRMPISKAKLALEMIEKNKYTTILQKSINQIDTLTNELLEVERLNANTFVFDKKEYSLETIISEALSKMIIFDENEIEIEVKNNFKCYADLEYLSIAVKNLIDNALKYKEEGSVQIFVDENYLQISNIAKPLSKPLSYYVKVFVQENQAPNTGYGLGLNIVKRILDFHEFKLDYTYKDGKNNFMILFS